MLAGNSSRIQKHPQCVLIGIADVFCAEYVCCGWHTKNYLLLTLTILVFGSSLFLMFTRVTTA